MGYEIEVPKSALSVDAALRGKCLFKEESPNVFLLAKKKSGKTVVIWNIIKECIDFNDIVFLFCPSIDSDPTYLEIIKYLAKNRIAFILKKDLDLLGDFLKAIQDKNFEDQHYTFILDDLSTHMRSKELTSLLKRNRHIPARVILSSQYLNDIDKGGRLQIDYLLLFGGMPLKKLEEIHKDLDLSITFPDFLDVYREATSVKYRFLNISVRDESSIRFNFN